MGTGLQWKLVLHSSDFIEVCRGHDEVLASIEEDSSPCPQPCLFRRGTYFASYIMSVRWDCGICFCFPAVTRASAMNCLLCAGGEDGLHREYGEYRGFILTDPSIQAYLVSGAAQSVCDSVHISIEVLVFQEPGLWKQISPNGSPVIVESGGKTIAIIFHDPLQQVCFLTIRSYGNGWCKTRWSVSHIDLTLI